MNLTDLMRPVRHVLLDFDGPVCSVFGELPAHVVARRLAEAIDADLPAEVVGTDPLALLSLFAERGRDTLIAAEAKLRELELEAVQTAPITPGVVAALDAFRDTGRTATIVSNNAQDAVVEFLGARGLMSVVAGVCSRQHPEPELLKPNPFLVRRAMAERGASNYECVMIGDSATDVRAGDAAGVPIIGYAPRQGKERSLAEATRGRLVIAKSMNDIARAAHVESEVLPNFHH
ncbi:HAD family hydrolase [Actinomycetospora sp. TBRC 11914]|uniref:HAD family hydrolase n=1 Tax=Actinomycetospora sp. TBRC 11914 TaxID=2729387 RepID=UPI00145F3A03|nr:HAD hydrolase-like protein [Actinomycetospora sp. TBRC 11914]NMO93998.1 HAD family hydrolase [Actinomycetospora sp. TBRC 11914]